jgi:hypothetical protein
MSVSKPITAKDLQEFSEALEKNPLLKYQMGSAWSCLLCSLQSINLASYNSHSIVFFGTWPKLYTLTVVQNFLSMGSAGKIYGSYIYIGLKHVCM